MHLYAHERRDQSLGQRVDVVPSVVVCGQATGNIAMAKVVGCSGLAMVDDADADAWQAGDGHDLLGGKESLREIDWLHVFLVGARGCRPTGKFAVDFECEKSPGYH
jgi:hypothetical protein